MSDPSDAFCPWYAVRLRNEAIGGQPENEWLEDTCAGGSLAEFGRAVWFDSPEEARDALVSADLELSEFVLVRLQVDPEGGNHYLTEDVAWP